MPISGVCLAPSPLHDCFCCYRILYPLVVTARVGVQLGRCQRRRRMFQPPQMPRRATQPPWLPPGSSAASPASPPPPVVSSAPPRRVSSGPPRSRRRRAAQQRPRRCGPDGRSPPPSWPPGPQPRPWPALRACRRRPRRRCLRNSRASSRHQSRRPGRHRHPPCRRRWKPGHSSRCSPRQTSSRSSYLVPLLPGRARRVCLATALAAVPCRRAPMSTHQVCPRAFS